MATWKDGSEVAADSYIVSLGSWCPKPTTTAAGLRDCHI